MTQIHPQCQHLASSVDTILQLINAESNNIQLNTAAVEASLRKAVSPKFEIVFAGAFSAGKSMLINALLERELLYSAEGHATGTECYIEYAEADQERVVLTFLSVAEIEQQASRICSQLYISLPDWQQSEVNKQLQQQCRKMIAVEGGESKSERAKSAKALLLLLQGYLNNQDKIKPDQHATYSMDQFDFANLTEAASYARRGSNSAVLKRVEYYCHHRLLQDGNVLVDMPGIDAPVKEDAQLTYNKIEDDKTSAVVCVLKPAAAGEMTQPETELLEKMRANPGIRDRVFYVFNRIDQTWYNAQLRQRLDGLIQSQFRDQSRVYKTSGLLGFWGSQVKHTTAETRYGLDSLFADSVKSIGGEEETPQFISEFNNYCANSGKLTRSSFKVSVNGYETANQNYTRILDEWGTELIDQLIDDSGIEAFRRGITRYLTEEKRPQLFASLADDLQPPCIQLQQLYLDQLRELDSQPQEIETMKAQELSQLNQQLKQVGEEFRQHLETEVNRIITNGDRDFEADFCQLKAKMVSRLDELLQTFSVAEAYSRATYNHRRNATAPLLAVLVEALYYLANQLEDVLVAASQELVSNFVARLQQAVETTPYYQNICHLLGNDGGIRQQLQQLEERLSHAISSEARTECDRYVRESPRFYDEGTFSIYQFRQTLQQTSQGYDCESMVQAEAAIRQLLKLDFELKVSNTIRRNFRQTVNQTLKTQLLPLANQQADAILQQYSQARANLEKTLEQEAASKIALNRQLQSEVEAKIDSYNQAATAFNQCLQVMQLHQHQLPLITSEETGIKMQLLPEDIVSNNGHLAETSLSLN